MHLLTFDNKDGVFSVCPSATSEGALACPASPFRSASARRGWSSSIDWLAIGLAAWERGIAPLVPTQVWDRVRAANPFRPFLRQRGPSIIVADLRRRAGRHSRPRRRRRLHQRPLGGPWPRRPRRRLGAARRARGRHRPGWPRHRPAGGADRQRPRAGAVPSARLSAGVGGVQARSHARHRAAQDGLAKSLPLA